MKITFLMRALCMVFGFLVLMVGLWGGSWLVKIAGPDFNFAAFMTAFLLCAAGVSICGLTFYPEDKI